jgi:hypothetical protein
MLLNFFDIDLVHFSPLFCQEGKLRLLYDMIDDAKIQQPADVGFPDFLVDSIFQGATRGTGARVKDKGSRTKVGGLRRKAKGETLKEKA